MSPQEKYRIFFEELKAFSVFPSSQMTQDEILRTMDTKSGGQFDRHITEQLFEQMEPDHNYRYSMEEFYQVWNRAEGILRNKIDQSEKVIEDGVNSREEAVRRLDQVQKSERLNANGIMENSTLTVTIEEGENFRDALGNPIRAYIVLTCEGSSY